MKIDKKNIRVEFSIECNTLSCLHEERIKVEIILRPILRETRIRESIQNG